jgi:uncharacterized protein HemX
MPSGRNVSGPNIVYDPKLSIDDMLKALEEPRKKSKNSLLLVAASLLASMAIGAGIYHYHKQHSTYQSPELLPVRSVPSNEGEQYKAPPKPVTYEHTALV